MFDRASACSAGGQPNRPSASQRRRRDGDRRHGRHQCSDPGQAAAWTAARREIDQLSQSRRHQPGHAIPDPIAELVEIHAVAPKAIEIRAGRDSAHVAVRELKLESSRAGRRRADTYGPLGAVVIERGKRVPHRLALYRDASLVATQPDVAGAESLRRGRRAEHQRSEQKRAHQDPSHERKSSREGRFTMRRRSLSRTGRRSAAGPAFSSRHAAVPAAPPPRSAPGAWPRRLRRGSPPSLRCQR